MGCWRRNDSCTSINNLRPRYCNGSKRKLTQRRIPRCVFVVVVYCCWKNRLVAEFVSLFVNNKNKSSSFFDDTRLSPLLSPNDDDDDDNHRQKSRCCGYCVRQRTPQ